MCRISSFGYWLAVASMFSLELWAQSPSENPLKNAKDGVTVNEPAAYRGYSLVAPMNSTTTYLIDLEGRIVKEWKSEFTPALSAYFLENGHLLRPGAERGFGAGGPGSGGRIQEFDWDGNLVWDYSFGDSKLRPHHDICRLPNGNVLVVAADPKTKEEAVAAGRRPESVRTQLRPECILEIKPTGKTTGEIVWEWHAWDHIIQDADKTKPNFGDVSEHPERIDLNFQTNMMDRMMQDPQQLARLRSLGYVGGGAVPNSAGDAQKPTAPSRPDAKPEEGEPRDRPRPDGGPGRGPGGPGGPGGGPMDGDWMHVNSVTYNAKLDQIMISVHEFHEVWIIDHGTTTKEAAAHQGGRSGKGGDLLYRWGNPVVYRSGTNVDQRLFAQHCAHWIADGLPGAGNMLVFNNGNGRPAGGFSSIDEIELPLTPAGYRKEEFVAFEPASAKWSYSAPDKTSFFSALISGAQRLPNGNTFICSGNQAILFEVTPKGEIVWQYKHPGGGFGFGGPGGPPRPGELVPEFLGRLLQLTDSQKADVQKIQEDVDKKIQELLTPEQKEKSRPPAGLPFGPFGGGPGFGPPAGGPPGPGAADRGRFRMPRIGEVMSPSVADGLSFSDDQKKKLAGIQSDVDTRLGAVWSDRQKEQISETDRSGRAGGPPGFGPPGFGPPGGPPGPGFGPPGFGRGGPGGRRPGGPGGIFRSYRYGPDYPGIVGRELTPGKKLEEVAVAANRPPNERPALDEEAK